MKKHFVTGLVILLPVAVTVAILVFIINFLTKPFMGLVVSTLGKMELLQASSIFRSETVIRYMSQFLILISLFLFTLILGMVTRWFFTSALIRLGDMILHRIPIVNTVYKTSQEIIRTLFASNKNSFKQVVMVPFPTDTTYMLGLVSSESPKICSDLTDEGLVSVLVPTTPNPTTGFLMMCRRCDLIFIDMKIEDAIKYIVSCGVITPESPQADYSFFQPPKKS